VLICGVLILVGLVAMTKMQRIYETAILKTLGAKRRVLFRVTLIEYGVLGLLAGAIGSGSVIAVTWTMSRLGDRPLPGHLHPWINVAGAVLTAILVVLAGLMATWDVRREEAGRYPERRSLARLRLRPSRLRLARSQL
jgi:putative ABC transport system permease protein